MTLLHNKQDILRKMYPCNCFVMTTCMLSFIADDTSVSTFCVYTRKLGPEEVSVSLIAV